MVDKLVAQLDAGRERTIDSLRGCGMEPVARPRGGMFVTVTLAWGITAPVESVTAPVIVAVPVD